MLELISPEIDIVFNKLFSDKQVAMDFLNTILKKEDQLQTINDIIETDYRYFEVPKLLIQAITTTNRNIEIELQCSLMKITEYEIEKYKAKYADKKIIYIDVLIEYTGGFTGKLLYDHKVIEPDLAEEYLFKLQDYDQVYERPTENLQEMWFEFICNPFTPYLEAYKQSFPSLGIAYSKLLQLNSDTKFKQLVELREEAVRECNSSFMYQYYKAQEEYRQQTKQIEDTFRDK